MKYIDISDNIREKVCEETSALISIYKKVDVKTVKKIIENVTNEKNVISRYSLGNNLVVLYNTPDMVKTQMFTDHYRMIRQKVLLDMGGIIPLPKTTKEEINIIYDDNQIFAYMLDSMLSTYMITPLDKVILNKCLVKDDIEYLKSINPFFEDEYNLYNRTVDLDFIIESIKNVQGEVEEDAEYTYAAENIFKLYKINDEEVYDLMKELYSKGASIYSSTNPYSDGIKIRKITITKELLALTLKDYYETYVKELKYKKDDNDGVK